MVDSSKRKSDFLKEILKTLGSYDPFVRDKDRNKVEV